MIPTERSASPILNESGSKAKIDLHLPSFQYQESDLKDALNRQGYTLETKERTLLIYTLSDQPTDPLNL